MKKIFLALIFILSFSSLVWATPFLVCDPQATVTQYTLEVKDASGNIIQTVLFAAQADGSAKYDLASFVVGKYTFRLRCADVSGWWSDYSDPFTATKPGRSGNVHIVP